ncbi:MAG: hypothetical protein HSCHL_1561 [Hydrogenibacillus schlegelii]|uniref:Uncharacterized protein n=1 Tax=Hydrogenibacillus schlegelii TaxID=1484 RepID=A0A2T5G4C7_HYDSH|nr:hypothetical protein [Hydrogenibacillus schlegelii]PTQ51051.1 MAG: hypothetical protein HSCHL_1561 [Hydrogenibacillus schlegelii]
MCEEEIRRLKSELQDLRDEILLLRMAIIELAYAKVTDPKFAYFDWRIRYGVTFDEEKIMRLNWVFHVLTERIKEEPIERIKSIPGISDAVLYRKGPPTYREALTLLMQALGTKNEIMVEELIESLQSQGILRELVDFLCDRKRSEVKARSEYSEVKEEKENG